MSVSDIRHRFEDAARVHLHAVLVPKLRAAGAKLP
jgi:hypothetical protein